MGKMTIWRVKCLAKVAHTIMTVVLNIPTPVRMTPLSPLSFQNYNLESQVLSKSCYTDSS